MFILVTSRPDVLLPTVRSRCPQLRFRPLAADEIATALVARGRSESEARAVAATADGSLGQALRRAPASWSRRASVAQRVLAQPRRTGPARRLEGAKELLSKTGSGGAPIAISWRRTCAPWRRCCATSRCWRPARTLARWPMPDVRPALERLTQTYGGERGVRAFGAIDRALVALERNAGVKLVADWLVLQL